VMTLPIARRGSSIRPRHWRSIFCPPAPTHRSSRVIAGEWRTNLFPPALLPGEFELDSALGSWRVRRKPGIRKRVDRDSAVAVGESGIRPRAAPPGAVMTQRRNRSRSLLRIGRRPFSPPAWSCPRPCRPNLPASAAVRSRGLWVLS
jgi:hypothetical protein